MGVPYAIVKGRARLGLLVNKKTATAVAINEVRPEHKQELASLVSSIRSNYNDKFEEARKQWGGGLLGFKSEMAQRKKLAEKAKQEAERVA